MDIIEPESAEDFRKYYILRWKVLRAPWKQPPGSERDPLDDSSTHLMMVDRKRATIGVGRLHFNGIREAQIRYMAITTGKQRQGLGSRLLLALEQRARQHGAARMVLDARESALRFYHKHGYRVVEPGHTLFNSVTHVRMEKEL